MTPAKKNRTQLQSKNAIVGERKEKRLNSFQSEKKIGWIIKNFFHFFCFFVPNGDLTSDSASKLRNRTSVQNRTQVTDQQQNQHFNIEQFDVSIKVETGFELAISVNNDVTNAAMSGKSTLRSRITWPGKPIELSRCCRWSTNFNRPVEFSGQQLMTVVGGRILAWPDDEGRGRKECAA